MTRDDLTRMFDRRHEAWERRDADALAQDHAEHGTVHSPRTGLVTGRANIANAYRSWFAAFPDIQIHREELLVDGDNVALFFTSLGTHNGDFMGIEGCGRRFEVRGVFLYKFADGLIAQERRIYDFTGLLVQLGVLKAKPA
jgi:steroid delta-isomerase-like uncharacterized protein